MNPQTLDSFGDGLLRRARSAKIFEFGTFTGAGTLHIAMNTRESATITTLDLGREARSSAGGWHLDIDDQTIGERFRATQFAGRITQIYGDSMALDVTPFLGDMDFVWIDACHEYHFVRNDSEKAFQMLRSGGVIAWHDYSTGSPGVSRFLSELATSRS